MLLDFSNLISDQILSLCTALDVKMVLKPPIGLDEINELILIFIFLEPAHKDIIKFLQLEEPALVHVFIEENTLLI